MSLFGVPFSQILLVLSVLPIPVLVWTAYLDIRTRRVPNWVWGPLFVYALLVLCVRVFAFHDYPGFTAFLYRTGLSIALVGGLGLLSGLAGVFGGADAKAIMWVSVMYPVFPPGLDPVLGAGIGMFSLAVIVNSFLLGFTQTILLTVRNAVRGNWEPAMFISEPKRVSDLPHIHGRVVSSNGSFGSGLDLDVLRMYLRWRGVSIKNLRAHSEWFRNVIQEPVQPRETTDGRVDSRHGFRLRDGSAPEWLRMDSIPPLLCVTGTKTDLWGVDSFVEDAERVYGETPESIRRGLDQLTDSSVESVWVSPGLPFFVYLVLGLVVTLFIGDVVSWVLGEVPF